MLLSSPPPLGRLFDLCVVGAGPVGLSLALEASALGLDVLLVEAGPAQRPRRLLATAADLTATVLDPSQHASLEEATTSGIGGTSWLWGGRCVPFEPVDFDTRSYVPHSGWPITRSDALCWQDRAAEYLDCGAASFRSPEPSWAGLEPVELVQQERWSRDPKVGRHLGARVVADHRLSLLCDAVVTDLVLTGDATVAQELRGRHEGEAFSVRSRNYALACGGLKTTRLLLNVQQRTPTAFGGVDGALGRYYAGHLTGSIADLHLTSPADFADLDFQRDRDGTDTRRRFTLSPQAQRDDEILNTAFYAGNPPFSDHHHGSGALSALFLALAAPLVGRRLAPEETRVHNVEGSDPRYARHLLNIVRRPLRTARDLLVVVRRRLLSTPRRRVFVVPNERGVYALRYHAEQAPQPANRVSLNDDVGADGLNGIDVRFSFADSDIASVLRAHALLDARLRASGRGRLSYRRDPSERVAAVRSQSRDGYHQVGTTRMSADPRTGVVDGNCRVHGMSNLYVASTSTFPTAGEANPTFMGTCLALRLAHHLAEVDHASESSPRS